MSIAPWAATVERLIAQLDAARDCARADEFAAADALLEAHDAELRAFVTAGVPADQRESLAQGLRRVLEREREVMSEFERARDEAAKVLAGFQRARVVASEYKDASNG